MTGTRDEAEFGPLVQRIADCIGEADARGLHLVAAHLDAALTALRADGEDRPCTAAGCGKPLH